MPETDGGALLRLLKAVHYLPGKVREVVVRGARAVRMCDVVSVGYKPKGYDALVAGGATRQRLNKAVYAKALKVVEKLRKHMLPQYWEEGLVEDVADGVAGHFVFVDTNLVQFVWDMAEADSENAVLQGLRAAIQGQGVGGEAAGSAADQYKRGVAPFCTLGLDGKKIMQEQERADAGIPVQDCVPEVCDPDELVVPVRANEDKEEHGKLVVYLVRDGGVAGLCGASPITQRECRALQLLKRGRTGGGYHAFATELLEKLEQANQWFEVLGRRVRCSRTQGRDRISAYDVISVVCACQEATSMRKYSNFGPEVKSMFSPHQFMGQGQRSVPAGDAVSTVKLILSLNGWQAKHFRFFLVGLVEEHFLQLTP